MFPGPHATVYYNEAGEPLGWSDESSYEAEPLDAGDYERQYGASDAWREEQYDTAYDTAQTDAADGLSSYAADYEGIAREGYEAGWNDWFAKAAKEGL